MQNRSQDCQCGRKVAFATHVYFKDYDVVLDPGRFAMVVQSHGFDFSDVLIVLNNFESEKDWKKAQKAAHKLIDMGLATRCIDALSYLTDDVLKEFGLEGKRFWKQNPYFATSQITALHWLRKRADYVLHMAGDVWLDRPMNWIPAVLPEIESRPEMLGFNLCRGVYEQNYPICYPNWNQDEDDVFWVSRHLSVSKDPSLVLPVEKYEGRGWGLSDLAYFVRLNPSKKWDLRIREEDAKKYMSFWVGYARPCFEMYLTLFMYRSGFCYGALKPLNGQYPKTNHKNFTSNKVKQTFYRLLGRYKPGGRYATKKGEGL